MISLEIQYMIAFSVLVVAFCLIGGFVYLIWKEDNKPKNQPPTPPK